MARGSAPAALAALLAFSVLLSAPRSALAAKGSRAIEAALEVHAEEAAHAAAASGHSHGASKHHDAAAAATGHGHGASKHHDAAAAAAGHGHGASKHHNAEAAAAGHGHGASKRHHAAAAAKGRDQGAGKHHDAGHQRALSVRAGGQFVGSAPAYNGTEASLVELNQSSARSNQSAAKSQEKEAVAALGLNATASAGYANNSLVGIFQRQREMLMLKQGGGHLPVIIVTAGLAELAMLVAIIVGICHLHKARKHPNIGVGSVLCALCCCPCGCLALCYPIDEGTAPDPAPSNQRA